MTDKAVRITTKGAAVFVSQVASSKDVGKAKNFVKLESPSIRLCKDNVMLFRYRNDPVADGQSSYRWNVDVSLADLAELLYLLANHRPNNCEPCERHLGATVEKQLEVIRKAFGAPEAVAALEKIKMLALGFSCSDFTPDDH